MATGIKRVRPDRVVFTYQGDGDLAAIGTAEIIHTANRGELITTIFVNNAIYGMTGGQMAPTTLPGQVTTSSPVGRDIATTGRPIQMAELIGTLPGAAYVTRQAVLDVPTIRRTKRAIKRAFQAQLAGLGFSMVEVLSTCPTNWRLGPVEALVWAREHMVAAFPLGDTRVTDDVRALAEVS
jgi:2-oxoglutarate ferredoxin oxidoreductase subunit beta